MSRWWRAYDDAVNNPKLQRLPAVLFKGWFNLCCIASKHNGELPTIKDVAFCLRISEQKAEELVEKLVAAKLLDRDGNVVKPHDWQHYQYQSDSSAERMRRHRAKTRDVTSDVTVTLQNRAETDTETEQKQSRDVALRAPADKARGTRLANDWQPVASDIEEMLKRGYTREHLEAETEKFKNFWLAKAGAAARKVDWPRTWINWILNSKPNGGFNGPRPAGSARRPAGNDFFAGLAAVAKDIAGDGGMAGTAAEEVPLGRVNIDG